MHVTAEDRYAASELLILTKSDVRNRGIAITETSTPFVRAALQRQLNECIHAHAQIFYYTFAKGLYPSYSVEQTIRNDFENAQMALQFPVR